jgi:hypothetical protein
MQKWEEHDKEMKDLKLELARAECLHEHACLKLVKAKKVKQQRARAECLHKHSCLKLVKAKELCVCV